MKKLNYNQDMDKERKVFLQDILAEAYEAEEKIIQEQKEGEKWKAISPDEAL